MSAFNTSDGCAIEYHLRSSKISNRPRVVLIHSLALDSSIWDPVVSQLIERADVLTYDCRGHGCSQKLPAAFTTELFARDLAQLLVHVGWSSAVVAGCSMGGCVAQAFAGLYAARVNGLALIDTTAWYGKDAPKAWRERADAARSKGLAALVDFQVTRWFSDPFRNAHPNVVASVTKIFLANDLDCYAASCMMLADADLREYLPSLRMPVEIVVGEEDYATPVSAAQALHDAIPGSSLTIIPKARHLTPIEYPGEIASHVVRLLA